jgi:hypothetical protein
LTLPPAAKAARVAQQAATAVAAEAARAMWGSQEDARREAAAAKLAVAAEVRARPVSQ